MTSLLSTFGSEFNRLSRHWTWARASVNARRQHRLTGSVLALACLTALCTNGCSKNLVRISNGSIQKERAISPQAYAAYTRARLQERAGDHRAATASYEAVLRLDGEADEAWVRLGALRCGSNPLAATRAFERATRLNPDSAALFREMTRCSLAHRDCASALSTAAAAVHLAPSDPTVSQLAIRIELTCGSHQQAERLAWSHVAVFPKDTAGWLALADIVKQQPNLRAQVLKRASERIVRHYDLWSTLDTSAPKPTPKRVDLAAGDRVELEHALANSDRAGAQRAARQLGLGVIELMALAFDLGALEFAHAQATLAGQIQPEDPRIWLKRLELADRLRDDEEFERLLEQAPRTIAESVSVMTDPLLELVARRTGLEFSPMPTR